ncbi:hypothetical protein GGS23DRAFT_560334 [Durotheca rogersii]|uniref:uncharacterized protein n=1 Tax=Durotheca rogersii TaxID=419775 RepID=UPI002220F48D|nr:uncharacterized protein GGS23DRAFT_560334 [Durotheca rogersii]KAI5864477.1 hypothetical protein GGS23DRAFT_560334 [Durotheca rogersii]
MRLLLHRGPHRGRRCGIRRVDQSFSSLFLLSMGVFFSVPQLHAACAICTASLMGPRLLPDLRHVKCPGSRMLHVTRWTEWVARRPLALGLPLGWLGSTSRPGLPTTYPIYKLSLPMPDEVHDAAIT